MSAPRARWSAQPAVEDGLHIAKPAPTDSTNILREIGAQRAFPRDTRADKVVAQKAADSELEARNAAACLVNDSGYWNREP
jgi:hypothetical protein